MGLQGEGGRGLSIRGWPASTDFLGVCCVLHPDVGRGADYLCLQGTHRLEGVAE